MAIESLKRIFNIPLLKREQRVGLAPDNKKKQKQNNKKAKENKDNNIDIRV